MIKDTVPADELSGRIHHQKINEELEAAGFSNVGWVVRHGANGVDAIDFEFDAALGYDPEGVKAVLRNHLRDPNEKDDRQEAEERGPAPSIEARLAAIEARLAALERS